MYPKEKNRFFQIAFFMLAVMGMVIAVLHISVYAKQGESVVFGSFPQSEILNVSNELETAEFDENGDAFTGGKKYRRVGCEGAYRYFVYEPLKWDVIADRNGYLTLMTKVSSDSGKSEHAISVRIEIGYGMMEGNSDWYNKVNELVDMAQNASDNPAGQIAEYLIWLSENTYYEGALWGGFSSSPVYLSGRGVCANYAAAFKDFCDASGIPATIVNASAANHAFNSVYLDGKWYLIDTTGGYLRGSKDDIRSNPFTYVTNFTSPSHYEGKYSKKYLKIVQDIALQLY